MVEALSTIEDERSISQEETLEILRQSFEKDTKILLIQTMLTTY